MFTHTIINKKWAQNDTWWTKVLVSTVRRVHKNRKSLRC